MTEEAKMLLRLILAQEEESEAGQAKPYNKKKTRSPEPAPAVQPDKPKTIKDFRIADLEHARREMYASHEAANVDPKDVPIWAKYALSLPEAASYFHIGYNKLREIVRKDKYADYLLWNGGRVYIKRKLFEEFLNNETEV